MTTKQPRDASNWAALSNEFYNALGMFHALYSITDLTIDYSIGLFLKVPPTQAHLITSGLMFGKKAKLLADLVGRSDHPNRANILDALNKLRASKRDVIAHSYIWSDNHTFKFIERNAGSEFKAVEHEFTLQTFALFVAKFHEHGLAFHKALGSPEQELEDFANAAFSLNRKSSRTAPMHKK